MSFRHYPITGGGDAAFRERAGFGPLPTLAVYFVGAALTALIIAILRPLRKTVAGSCFIGFCAFLPLSLGFGAFLVPRQEWYPAGVVLALIMALLYGIGVGIVLFRESKGWTQ